MGDRISIQFKDKEGQLSPVLFSHWDGQNMLVKVKYYCDELYQYHRANDDRTPLSRMEADTVIVDFIRFLTEGKGRVNSNYYLGCTENDGDNSDNGHHVWNLYTAGWEA